MTGMSMMVPDSLSFKAIELLNMAIMTKVPVLIVEGRNDVPIFQRISQSIGKRCDVFASENISSPEGGCSGVLKNIATIREFSTTVDIRPYVLGIVDRDARVYRDEQVFDDSLLMLNYYSIESHFVSQEAIRFIVEKTTSATGALLTDVNCQTLFDEIKTDLDSLYYCSLEALRKACEADYDAELTYGEKIRSIIKQGKPERVSCKSAELDEFANRLGVTRSLEDLLRICKGKWIFQYFVDSLITKLNGLKSMCKDNILAQCQYCIHEAFHNCLYSLTANFTNSQLEQLLLQDTEQEKLGYIKSRIAELAQR
jgi:hypothetical protein